jgi:hypothetical protein
MESSIRHHQIFLTDGDLGSTYAPTQLKSLHIAANASIAHSPLSAIRLPDSFQSLTVALNPILPSKASTIVDLLERMAQLWSEVHNHVRPSPPHVRLALGQSWASNSTCYTVEYKSVTKVFKMHGGPNFFKDGGGFQQHDGGSFRAHLCPLVNTVSAEQEWLTRVGALGPHLWAFSGWFPAWERLEFTAPKPRAIMGEVQLWADTRERLGYPPVIISISPDGSFRRPDMVKWNPRECSLINARWTTSETIVDTQSALS